MTARCQRPQTQFPSPGNCDGYTSRYSCPFMLSVGSELEAKLFNRAQLLLPLWAELRRHKNSEEVMTLLQDKGPEHLGHVTSIPLLTQCRGCSVGQRLTYCVALAQGNGLAVVVSVSRKADGCEPRPCLGPTCHPSAAASRSLSSYSRPKGLCLLHFVWYCTRWSLVT